MIPYRVHGLNLSLRQLRAEVLCLVPVLASFALPGKSTSQTLSALQTVLLFGGMSQCRFSSKAQLIQLLRTGMSASRVGLWSFDLIQVKQLQETLAEHPRRNALYVVGDL